MVNALWAKRSETTSVNCSILGDWGYGGTFLDHGLGLLYISGRPDFAQLRCFLRLPPLHVSPHRVITHRKPLNEVHQSKATRNLVVLLEGNGLLGNAVCGSLMEA